MTIHIELNAEMEAQLAADACLRGMEVEIYAQRLLQEALSAKGQSAARASQEEFRAFLDALASRSPAAPHLCTDTFSREMIYGEHDWYLFN